MNAGADYPRYSFVHARLGSLKGELLGEAEWKQLLEAVSYLDQMKVLASTNYAPWLKDNPEDTLPGILNEVYRVARKIEQSAPATAARFIHLWARRDLLRNLKTILKGKALGRSEQEIRADLIDVGPFYPATLESLLECPNVEAVLDLLETTSVRRWIRAARRIYERDRTLFGLDAALDRLYYPDLWQQLDQLNAADRASVHDLAALEIDHVNLLWLLRYRLNYQLSPAETYYLLVPVTGQITADMLKRLVREESLEAILGSIPVQSLRATLAGCRSIWRVEVALWRYRRLIARRTLQQRIFTLGEALAVLVLKVIEVRDLVALLEGIRLNMPQAEIQEQLTGYGNP